MRNKFTVGVWSDSSSDTAVVRSMIKLISERTEDEWAYADTQKVDLLLVGKHSEDAPEAENRIGSVLACLAENEESIACPTPLTVVRPLRFMPFMELLQEASKHLAALQPAAEEPLVVDAGPGLGHLELANALQELCIGATSPIVGLVSKSGKTLATLNFQDKAMTSAYQLPTLMRLLHTRVSRIDDRSEKAWLASCEQARKIPLETFFWNLGRDMGIYHGLAPWLGMNDIVQLNGWPDFGEIKATQDEIKLCALLSRGALNPRELAKESHIDSVQVNGFLNSASLCDLLALNIKEQPTSALLKVDTLGVLGADLARDGSGAALDAGSHPELDISAFPALHDQFTSLPLAAVEAVVIDASDSSLTFKLKRWPPAETLKKDAGRIRIATILSRRSISIKELVSLSRVELHQCEDFLHTLAQHRLIATEKQALDIRVKSEVDASRSNSSIDKLGVKGAINLIQSIRRRFGFL